MVIIILLFGMILLALIIQYIIVRVEIKKRRSVEHQTTKYVYEGDLKEYEHSVDAEQVVLLGNKMMEALDAGKIKKQLLHNDAPEYDSMDTVKKYLDFISSNELSEYIMNIENGKYYGQG